ncbi:hypothetical protein NQ314_009920 [Rhamnusium bicolor]|uniref:Glycosyl transferase CAP10 domain-containing protein n=1 Tax=Rhamnusium bicolor TaxID=1586634 RepID=A0AAV8XYI9_9CUCU|nr:hypothetical protein NQ314_009920 [Rhamnusium bicolor]
MYNINIYLFLYVYLMQSAFNYTAANKSCSKDEKQNCKEEKINKYSKEVNTKYQKYLEIIREAKEQYIPCDESKCKCHSRVITNDLQVFKNKGISEKLIQTVNSKGTKYQIIQNRLYRDENCMFPARCSGIEHFLLDLLPSLPDMEFILNTRDWPQIHKEYGVFGPVFSFSKTENYHDIMYPAWSFWEGGPAISLYPRGIEDQELALREIHLYFYLEKKPELVDAQYTKNQAWKSDADTLHAPPAQEVSFEEHCKYKYLFNFRGVAASFRFKHILLCKSLVFHVGDEWLEFFYPALKPWIHYIPVEANANKEKLQELIDFAVNHDDIAHEIAQNGYSMIWNNLKMKDVSCYWSKLLKRYAKLLTYKPILDTALIEIKNK